MWSSGEERGKEDSIKKGGVGGTEGEGKVYLLNLGSGVLFRRGRKKTSRGERKRNRGKRRRSQIEKTITKRGRIY